MTDALSPAAKLSVPTWDIGNGREKATIRMRRSGSWQG